MADAARLLGLGKGTVVVLAGVALLLLGGSIFRGVMRLRRSADPVARERWRSVATWWGLFVILLLVLSLGRIAVGAAMLGAAVLLLREALDLARGEGAVHLGLALLLAVSGPAHVLAVATLPAPMGLPDTNMGWLLLLLVLTGLNDSAQAWWGRGVGRTPLAPRISPGKTWEGLVGGVATTVAVTVPVAPLLTSYGRGLPLDGVAPGQPWMWAACLGLVVGLAGTAGDLSASVLKRRAGVKDSGDLLPGHGGVLDRFDSLTLTAPAFYWLTRLLWF